jgi:hypothetical protein
MPDDVEDRMFSTPPHRGGERRKPERRKETKRCEKEPQSATRRLKKRKQRTRSRHLELSLAVLPSNL